ncbi:hypothetical protein BLNAU_11055 [Blattamonas nauphoetae]|uniref:Uncharacterized protein n=1 Tax=Blattamonas nauphoetae TaxID=2049346 RepID=A0ABQ9XNG8_9EUKA|nr:hypothetical protein BLNAU_11055 [Blattamonas nauphoetae]
MLTTKQQTMCQIIEHATPSHSLRSCEDWPEHEHSCDEDDRRKEEDERMERNNSQLENKFQANEPPKFLSDKHHHIKSFKEASTYYQSLICFVKERNSLYLTDVTFYACRFLWYLSPASWYHFSPDDILYSLVPTSDGSCSGFAESIVILLTSSDKKLVKAALELLGGLLLKTSPVTSFDILATRLFNSLQYYYFEDDIHYSQTPYFSLMNVVTMVLKVAIPETTREICEKRSISIKSFQQTFIDKLLEPIEPFLDFFFPFRRVFEKEKKVLIFSNLLAATVELSLIQKHMAQLAMSYSLIALVFTDSLALFESHNVTVTLLQSVLHGVRRWLKQNPAVLKRGRRVVAKLREEGLTDEIELFLGAYRFSQWEDRLDHMAVDLIDNFGGNIHEYTY